MRKRIKAAKNELDFDKSTFILGVLVGIVIGILLISLGSFVFGLLSSPAPGGGNGGETTPNITADIVVNDRVDSDGRVLIQLTNETNADSIYVVSDSDDPENRSSQYYVGEVGNPTVGSTVVVSVGSQSGEVWASKGDAVRIVGVVSGEEVVLRDFTV